MEATATSEQRPPRSGRAVVVAFAIVAIIAIIAIVGYFALGMPGMGHSGDAMAGIDQAEPDGPMPLAPQAFADKLGDSSAFVVNVHVPAGAGIAGTDASIAYNRIDDGRLPATKSTTILLYCETGRMSRIAGRYLAAAGYTDVSDLAGGMEAWRRAGLPLEER